jgi:hypothetical protein
MLCSISRLRQASHTCCTSCTQKKFAWVTGMSADDAAWMAGLPFSLSVPSRRFIVAHAGLVPGVPLCQQPLDAMYTVCSNFLAAVPFPL